MYCVKCGSVNAREFDLEIKDIESGDTQVLCKKCANEPLYNENAIIFDFAINDLVQIVPLEIVGRVVSLWHTSGGNEYEVRYFCNNDIRTEYFYPYELKEVF